MNARSAGTFSRPRRGTVVFNAGIPPARRCQRKPTKTVARKSSAQAVTVRAVSDGIARRNIFRRRHPVLLADAHNRSAWHQ